MERKDEIGNNPLLLTYSGRNKMVLYDKKYSYNIILLINGYTKQLIGSKNFKASWD